MRIKNTYILLIICLLSLDAIGQDLHAPQELKEIADKSSVRYGMILDTINAYPYFGREILTDDYYIQRKIGEQPEVMRYPVILDRKFNKILAQGEKAYQASNYEKAEKNYLKAIDKYDNDARYYQKISTIHFNENNYAAAKSWAHKALKVNFIHFPAHLRLAQLYALGGKEEEAIEAISLAHIYNRNNREIQGILSKIYKQFGHLYELDLEYDPKYKIQKSGDDINIIYQDEPWRDYGLCKAIWEYEPNYKKRMEVLKIEPEWLEEKECLLNMVIGYDQMSRPREKQMFQFGAALKLAIDKNMLDQFILYEIFLVQDPQLSFMLTQDEIDLLMKYLLEVRSKREIHSLINED